MLGTKIELEHTKRRFIARKIASDHLKEFPTYYTDGLIPMEKRLKRMKVKHKCKFNGGKNGKKKKKK